MEKRYDLEAMLRDIVEDEKLFSERKNVKMSQEEIKKLLKQRKKEQNNRDD